MSSTDRGPQNLAGWTDAKLLTALTELAHVWRDNGMESVERFAHRYPGFLTMPDMPPPTREEHVRARECGMEAMHKVILQENDSIIIHLSSFIDAIWRGTPTGMRMLLALLLIDDTREAVRAADAVRLVEDPGTGPRGRIILEGMSALPFASVAGHFQPDWVRQARFQYTPATPLQKALHTLWRKSTLARVCKNADCPAPYFIANRVQTQFCSEVCSTPFRLESKRKWWNKAGKERRQQEAKAK